MLYVPVSLALKEVGTSVPDLLGAGHFVRGLVVRVLVWRSTSLDHAGTGIAKNYF